MKYEYKWKWIFTCLVFGLVIFTSGGCKNKADQKCGWEAQQDGTMKYRCHPKKNIPDAGVDGGRTISLAKASYLLVELDRGFQLLDKAISFSVMIETDRGFEKKVKIRALRSERHEEAARLLLGDGHHYYAFVVENAKQFDAMIREVQAHTDKSARADISYSFSTKARVGRTLPLTSDKVVFWEKVPGQGLQKIPTEFSPVGLPSLPKTK